MNTKQKTSKKRSINAFATGYFKLLPLNKRKYLF